MNVTRRFILKLSSVTAGIGLLGLRSTVAAVKLDESAVPVTATPQATESMLTSDQTEGTLIISRDYSRAVPNLKVVNNTDETLVVREVAPHVAQVDGKLFDLNAELRTQALVVPANSVRSCALSELQKWQVHNPELVHDVRRARHDFRAIASVQRETQPGHATHGKFRMVA